MLKTSKRIVVISEGVNRYGFRTLLTGVDLGQYLANPVMLWMHNRAFGKGDDCVLPLGNVTELRIEEVPGAGKCLTGQPVFDDQDDFAKKIYAKFQNGTIRMASAGLIPVSWSEDESLVLPGQRGATLVKSVLEEISIVDIGADPNALALYNELHELVQLGEETARAIIPQLQLPTEHKMKIELTNKELLLKLALNENATAADVEARINETLQLALDREKEIKGLQEAKAAAEAEVLTLKADAAQVQTALQAEKIESLVQGAVDARKISAGEKDAYIKLAAADFGSVARILNDKPGTPAVSEQLSAAGTKDAFAGKSWEQLDRENKLVELKASNPQRFEEMYLEKFGKVYGK